MQAKSKGKFWGVMAWTAKYGIIRGTMKKVIGAIVVGAAVGLCEQALAGVNFVADPTPDDIFATHSEVAAKVREAVR